VPRGCLCKWRAFHSVQVSFWVRRKHTPAPHAKALGIETRPQSMHEPVGIDQPAISSNSKDHPLYSCTSVRWGLNSVWQPDTGETPDTNQVSMRRLPLFGAPCQRTANSQPYKNRGGGGVYGATQGVPPLNTPILTLRLQLHPSLKPHF